MKFDAPLSGRFYKGEHWSHMMDPVGTADTGCETCRALWDERVRRLHVNFLVALEAEDIHPATTTKVLAAWHKVVSLDLLP